MSMFSNLFGNSSGQPNNANNTPNIDKNLVLTDFATILGKLNEKNKIIQANINAKTKFGENLVINLKSINDQIQVLASKIKELQKRLTELDSLRQKNDSSIQTQTTKTTELEKQLAALQAQKDAAIIQLNNLNDSSAEENRNLTQQLNASQNELQRLTGEINGINKALGDATSSQQATAAQIQKMSEENKALVDAKQKELDEAQKVIDAKNQELIKRQQEVANTTDRIKLLNTQLANEKKNLQDENNKLKETIQNITNEQTQTQTEIAALNAKIQALTAENNDYIQRILQSNKILQDADASLEALNGSIPEEEANGLLLSIKNTITEINTMLASGNSQNGTSNTTSNIPSSSSQNNQNIQAENTEIKIPLSITRKDGTVEINLKKENILNILQDQLSRKETNNIPRSVTFTKEQIDIAINNIRTNPADFTNFLVNNNIKYDEKYKLFIFPAARGGKFRRTRKTKKIRKQKGGFTYTKRSKRTKIITKTTTASRKRSSNKSSRKRTK